MTGIGAPAGKVRHEAYRGTWRRFHKTGNVLAALPKSSHARTKTVLAEIWGAETSRRSTTA
jgi:hypothetical protein